MTKNLLKLSASFLVVAITAIAFGDTLSFQQGAVVVGSSNPNAYNATADSHISQMAPNTNYANYTDMYMRGARTIAPGYQTSVMLQFDDIQNWLDSGFEVTSARVRLTLFADVTAGTTVNVSRVLKEWTETGVTFNTTGTGVDWTEGGAWATTGDTPDRTIGLTSVAIPSDAKAGDSFWFDIDASIVQDWIDTPSSNSGLLLYIEIASGANFRWHSSESTASLRPLLEITGIPEPMTASLLCVGGLLVCRKRKA